MSKLTANKIDECLTRYETLVGLIEDQAEDADDPIKPSDDKLDKVLAEYLNLMVLAKSYKKEAKVTDADFNKEDSEYEYNDTWLKIQKENYMKFTKRFTVKKVDTPEEKVSNVPSLNQSSIERRKRGFKQERTEIEDSVKKVDDILSPINDGDLNQGRANSLHSTLTQIETRILEMKQPFEDYLNLLVEQEASTQESEHWNFTSTERAKINSLRDVIGKKVKVPEANSSIQVPLATRPKVVDLKKSEPPKFKGDILEFPEFKRKWKALVSNAGLPEESEVDKLKDSVTKEGRDLLYGVTNMEEAWKRLDKKFGDPRLISNQLKNDLKNVKNDGRTDAEKIKNQACRHN